MIKIYISIFLLFVVAIFGFLILDYSNIYKFDDKYYTINGVIFTQKTEIYGINLFQLKKVSIFNMKKEIFSQLNGADFPIDSFYFTYFRSKIGFNNYKYIIYQKKDMINWRIISNSDLFSACPNCVVKKFQIFNDNEFLLESEDANTDKKYSIRMVME